MALNRDAYVSLLKGLMPLGRSWPREVVTVFHKLFEAISEEFVRFDTRLSVDLVNESDPFNTLELLTDWERIAGLPDTCQLTVAETVGQRRADIVRKLSFRGGQSRQFYIDLCAALGYTVTIEEIRPFRSGISRSGDRCYDVTWKHHWRVHSEAVEAILFLSGTGRSGDRLRVFRNDTLECIINQSKPAHTTVSFVYGG